MQLMIPTKIKVLGNSEMLIETKCHKTGIPESSKAKWRRPEGLESWF